MGSIGFIGTGTIGRPMAQRLVDAGHDLVVLDVDERATATLVEGGATRAGSPRDVAQQCRIVFTSLPGPPEVNDVVLGEDGLLAGAERGDVHVDLSTNSFDAVRELHAREAGAGVALVDAPVSGGAHGAVQGNLTVMASGDEAALERARPYLEAFAKNIFFLGEPGSGTLVKLVNNAVFLCSGLLLQEGFVMAAKAGLDVRRLLEVLQVSSGAVYSGLASLMLGRDFDSVIFKLSIAEKDVSLALDSARALGVSMPVTEAARSVYANALELGLGEKVFHATLLALEDEAGVEVPRIGE